MAPPADARVLSPRTAGTVAPLVLLVIINLFNYVDRQVLAAIEMPISETFSASKTAMGWLVTGFLLVYMVFAPLFGWWADRHSKWKLIGFSMILQSLASGGSGLAQSYMMLLVMRCAVGIGEAAWGPAAPSLLADMYPVEKRGKIMAWFYAAIPVGSALGYAVGGGMLWLTEKMTGTADWRWAFYVLMPPGVIIGVICLFLKDPPKPPLPAGFVQSTKPSAGEYFQKVKSILKIPSFTINSIGMTLMTFAIGGIAFWMPRYLEADRSLSKLESTMVFGAVTALAGLLATITGGIIGDKLRSRFAGSYFHVCGVGMISGFPMFLLVLVTPFPYAWFFLFAAVFCLFLNTGPGNTILANVVPSHIRSTAFALNIFLIHLLGDAISPPIIGAIAERSKTATSSGLSTGFVVVSFVLLIGGVVWWLGAKHLERDTQRANGDADATAGTPIVTKTELPPVSP